MTVSHINYQQLIKLWKTCLNSLVLLQKKAADVAPELKGTSIFIVGKIFLQSENCICVRSTSQVSNDHCLL